MKQRKIINSALKAYTQHNTANMNKFSEQSMLFGFVSVKSIFCHQCVTST